MVLYGLLAVTFYGEQKMIRRLSAITNYGKDVCEYFNL